MRDQFLLDPDIVFLNHGSFGACPLPVLEAWQRWQRELERNPVELLGRRSATLLRAVRERLATELGADADDLALVPNATTGINTIARSWPLGPGDEVLASDHEYGACEAAWKQACLARGATYRRAEVPLPFEPASFAGRLLAASGPRTRVIFVSHITSTTALTFPLEALVAGARERGIAVVIDGAHAPGQLPLALDELGAEAYAGNGHKWWCAPRGSAFLHVRRDVHGLVQAPVVSWGYVADAQEAGHTGFDAYTGRTTLERRLLWQGTRDLTPWLALPAALEFWTSRIGPGGRADSHARAVALMHRVGRRNGLAPIAPDACFGQMVPIPVRCSDAEALRQRLFEHHRIEVPVTTHGAHTFVRVSVMPYTRDDELDALERALAAERV